MRFLFSTALGPFRLRVSLNRRYRRRKPDRPPRAMPRGRTEVLVGALTVFVLLGILGAIAATAGARSTGSAHASAASRLGAHARDTIPFTSPLVQPAPRRPHASPSSSAAAPDPVAEAAAGCYPESDEGACYEPGEFCSDADHGMTGVAGDGETVVCEDADGWRWEPAPAVGTASTASSSAASPSSTPVPTPSPSPTPTPSPTPSPTPTPTPSPAPTSSPTLPAGGGSEARG
jgi:hypothetical protein